MVTVFVPDIPEFRPLLEAARGQAGCAVRAPAGGYWRIEAGQALEFRRKPMGLGPALWNSALSGGFRGRIVEYGRDLLRIESDNQEERT